MTTTSQITQATYVGTFQNNMSSGADEAAKSMDNLGNSVETTDTKVTRSSGNWDTYVNKAAGAASVSRQLKTAELDLAQAAALRDGAVARGVTTIESSQVVLSTLSSRVDDLRGRYASMTQITDAAGGAFQVFAAQAKQAAEALQQNQATISSFNSNLDSLRAKYDTGFASANNYQIALKQLNAAQRVLGLSAEALAAEEEKITNALSPQAIAAKNAAAAQSELEAQARKYLLLVDPMTVHTREFNDTLAMGPDLLAKNAIGQEQFAKGLSLTAGSAGQASFAQRQFGIQMIQTFSSIQAGQPILSSLIGQGHQVADVMFSTGTGFGVIADGIAKAARAVASFLSSGIGLLITGLVAVGAALVFVALRSSELATNQRELQTAIDGTGRSLELSAQQLANNVQILERHGVAAKDALDAQKEFARNPFLSQQQINQITKVLPDAMAAMGKGAVDAGKLIAGAMDGSYDSIVKLDEALNLLTLSQRQSVKDAISQGDALGAQRIAVDALETRVKDAATKSESTWQITWRNIKNFAVDAIDGITTALSAVQGDPMAKLFGDIAQAQLDAQNKTKSTGITGTEPLDLATGLDAVSAKTKEQTLLVDALTKSWTDNARILSAQPKDRDAVKASIATEDAALKGLTDSEARGVFSARALADAQNTLRDSFRQASQAAEDQIGINLQIGPMVAAQQTPIDIARKRAEVSEQVRQQYLSENDAALVAKKGDEAVSNQRLADVDATTKWNQAQKDALSVAKAGVLYGQTQAAINAADAQSRATSATAIEQETNRKQAIAIVNAQIGAQRAQEISILNAETAGSLKLAAALDGGEAATVRAQAANDAYSQSLSKAGVNVASLTELLIKQKAAQAISSGVSQAQDLARELDYANKLNTALELGPQEAHAAELFISIDKVTHAAAALRDATTDPRQKAALQEIIDLIDRRSIETDLAKDKTTNLNEITQDKDALEVLRLQASLINATTVEQEKQVAELQKIQEIRRTETVNNGELDEEQRKRVALTGAIVEQTAALNQLKQDQAEIANAFSQAFDTISTAMVNAFLQGQGAAVNWGNVMKSVVQQVIAEFLKLAILNPLLNSLFGGTRSEIGGVVNALSGAGTVGGAGQSSGGGNIFGNGLTVLGVGNQLTGNGITQALGLNNLFGTIKSGIGNVTTSIGDFLATPIFGADSIFGPSVGAGAEAIAGPGASFASMDAAGIGVAGAAGPTVTLGALLGGAGAGFGVGSLAGGLVASSLGKAKGPNPEIGAGLGTAIGIGSVLLAPETFGLSLLAGGLIGGLLGGTAGGLIGPKPASPFSSIPLSIGPTGFLQQAPTISQKVDATQLTQATAGNVGWLNRALVANNVTLTSLGGTTQLGSNTPNGFQDPSKAASIGAAFPNFRFAAQDPNLSAVLSGRSFTGVDDLSNVITAVHQFTDALASTDAANRITDFLNTLGGVATADIPAKLQDIATFVTQTVPALTNQVQVTGSLNDALNQISASYDPAIAKAHELAYKEDELTVARGKATQAALDAAHAQLVGMNLSLQTRLAQARQTVTGVQDTGQALTVFDAQAQKQREDFSNQLVGIYGTSFKDTKDFAEEMALLETTLAAERLATIKQFASQAIAAEMSIADVAKAQHQLRVANTALDVRFWNAQGIINPAGQKGAADYALAVQQEAERRDFKKNLLDTWGDSFAATKDFADEMAALERTLGAERLAIQQQFNDKLTAQATTTITSLSDYARTLQNGSASPLSPQAQYDLASKQFNAVSGAAAAGDYNSIQKLTSYSDSLLQASRAVFGSGAGYASDFQKVLDALQSVAQVSPDTLTNSIYIAETRTQTQTLADAQMQAIAVLKSILLQLQQSDSRPARAA